MTRPDPIDELIRQRYPTPEPTPEDASYMRARLEKSILARQHQLTRRRRRPLALSLAALAMAVVVTVILIPGSVPPARASMGQIASILATVDPVEATDQSFVFIEAEQISLSFFAAADIPLPDFEGDHLVFFRPRTRSEWWGNEGTVQWVTVPSEPVFLKPEDREVVYAGGLMGDDVPGVPQTQTFLSDREGWPTDAGGMDSAIRERIQPELIMSADAQYVEIAIQALKDSFDRPEARAAALLGMGNLRDLEPVERPGELHTFQIEYTENGAQVRRLFAVDDEGYVRFEEIVILTDNEWGIPGGTTSFRATYSRPVLVDEIGQHP